MMRAWWTAFVFIVGVLLGTMMAGCGGEPSQESQSQTQRSQRQPVEENDSPNSPEGRLPMGNETAPPSRPVYAPLIAVTQSTTPAGGAQPKAQGKPARLICRPRAGTLTSGSSSP